MFTTLDVMPQHSGTHHLSPSFWRTPPSRTQRQSRTHERLQTLRQEYSRIQDTWPKDADQLAQTCITPSSTPEKLPSACALLAKADTLLEMLTALHDRQTQAWSPENIEAFLQEDVAHALSEAQADLTDTVQGIQTLQRAPIRTLLWLTLRIIVCAALAISGVAASLLCILSGSGFLIHATAGLLCIGLGLVPRLLQAAFDLADLQNAGQAQAQIALKTAFRDLKNLLTAQLSLVQELQNQQCTACYDTISRQQHHIAELHGAVLYLANRVHTLAPNSGENAPITTSYQPVCLVSACV